MDSLPNRLTSESPEVIYSDGGFLAVDDAMVSLLKDRAANSPGGDVVYASTRIRTPHSRKC